MTENTPLVFVGRLTRKEQIEFSLNDFFRRRFWSLLSGILTIPVGAFAISSAALGIPIKVDKSNIIVYLFYLLVMALIFISSIDSMRRKIQDQAHDTKIEITSEKLKISNFDISISLPTNSIRFRNIPPGIIAYWQGTPLLFLPERAFSAGSRAAFGKLIRPFSW